MLSGIASVTRVTWTASASVNAGGRPSRTAATKSANSPACPFPVPCGFTSCTFEPATSRAARQFSIAAARCWPKTSIRSFS